MKQRVICALLLCGVAGICAAADSDWFADKVLVEKSARKMYLLRNNEVVREYKIALGDNPVGHKQREGDERTPEGHYTIDFRNPDSRFFLSLRISYPNETDRRRALARGVSPGGDIFIHGLANGYRLVSAVSKLVDWTDGCIAVNNREMTEIWNHVRTGTPIEIRP